MAFVRVVPNIGFQFSFSRHQHCKSRIRSVAKSSTTSMATGTETKGKKLFALRTTHRPNISELRAKVRSAHREWAANEARLLFGGPLSDKPEGEVTGSLQIIRADSLEEAEAKFNNDPYKKAGIYADSDMREWVCGIRSDPPLPAQLFMVWCVDRPDCLQLRKDTRPRHLDWLKASKRQGLIGPFPTEGGACGTLLLVEGKDVEEVRAWAQNDPYCEVNLFETVHTAVASTVVEDGELHSS